MRGDTIALGRWLTLAAIAATVTACIPVSSSGACRENDECAAGSVCTDIRECSPADRAPPWRIAWTINGAIPSAENPGTCDPIDELELTITSSVESLSYAPLTCSAGSFAFLSLPISFNTARLEAFLSDGGQAVGRATVNRTSEPEITIDLEF